MNVHAIKSKVKDLALNYIDKALHILEAVTTFIGFVQGVRTLERQ